MTLDGSTTDFDSLDQIPAEIIVSSLAELEQVLVEYLQNLPEGLCFKIDVVLKEEAARALLGDCPIYTDDKAVAEIQYKITSDGAVVQLGLKLMVMGNSRIMQRTVCKQECNLNGATGPLLNIVLRLVDGANVELRSSGNITFYTTKPGSDGGREVNALPGGAGVVNILDETGSKLGSVGADQSATVSGLGGIVANKSEAPSSASSFPEPATEITMPQAGANPNPRAEGCAQQSGPDFLSPVVVVALILSRLRKALSRR